LTSFNPHLVMPGLTRASIENKAFLAKKMDCRVKPGNDDF